MQENINHPPNHKDSDRKFCPVNKYPHQQPRERVETTKRLKALRSEMKRISTLQTAPLHGYIVTSDDEHQVNLLKHNQYIDASYEEKHNSGLYKN